MCKSVWMPLYSMSNNRHSAIGVWSVHFYGMSFFSGRGLQCHCFAKYVDRMELTKSVLTEWICFVFSSVPYTRETSFGDPDPLSFSIHPLSFLKGQNEVHLFLGQFMPGVRWLAGLNELNRWNNFVDKSVLMPLMMLLFVLPVSRRAWEVWLHSRLCHTWTPLWCAKGELYKVQSPGLCLPLCCF